MAVSPLTESCVTFQNKYVSPSILGGNTGEPADTDGAEETVGDGSASLETNWCASLATFSGISTRQVQLLVLFFYTASHSIAALFLLFYIFCVSHLVLYIPQMPFLN